MQRTMSTTAAREEREDWRELVRRAREQVRADLGERDLTPPEDVLREMRKEREEQLILEKYVSPGCHTQGATEEQQHDERHPMV